MNGYYPPPPYRYNFDPHGFQQPPAPQAPAARQARNQLRLLSIFAGLGLLGFMLMQQIFSGLLVFLGLGDAYLNNTLFQNAYGILFSIFCVGLPFLLVYLLLYARRQAPAIPLNAPRNKLRAFLLVLIGLLVCMAGNYATNGLILFFNLFGIELTAPEVQAPVDAFGCVILFLQSAVVPAIVEEFAMRGVVMQPLRKYGDWFAILMSSFVFALMHGNLVQAPFAFIAGIGLGYAVIASGSLWTGILIHLFNNSISVVQTIAATNLSPEKANLISAVLIGVIIAAGAAALLLYLFKKEMRIVLPLSGIPLRRGEKVTAYLFTPPMVLALALMIWSTRYYISVPFSTVLPTFLFFIAAVVAFIFSFSNKKATPGPM
ncbi:MAG: type II CAAX endopeptidase family protein [Candidatus Fimivicinus sp.]|nr:CPBP family intramembrane metalloprotease [Oscillospiraceae bacterium]MDY5590916.1 type II CAAX endopeptidase family protein [Candidatus Fimivicinus sp.]